MKKILVPTDFSENSENALHYAIALAQTTNAEIKLLNVVHMQGMPSATFGISKLMDMVEETIKKESNKALDEMLAKVSKGVDITKEALLTFNMTDTLRKYAVENNFDLIVAGTKGAGKIKKVFLGSNASAMVEQIPLPILVVPEEAKFKDAGHFTYATDLYEEERDFAEVIRVARLFKCKVSVLHVDTSGKADAEAVKKMFTAIADTAFFKDFEVHVVKEKDVITGLQNFLEKTPSDFLCVVPEKRNMFEKVFDRSVTKELAYQATLPTLAIKTAKK